VRSAEEVANLLDHVQDGNPEIAALIREPFSPGLLGNVRWNDDRGRWEAFLTDQAIALDVTEYADAGVMVYADEAGDLVRALDALLRALGRIP
jgi:hypothetical protein